VIEILHANTRISLLAAIHIYIQFNPIQFILRSSDPGGVLDPEDIEHVN